VDGLSLSVVVDGLSLSVVVDGLSLLQPIFMHAIIAINIAAVIYFFISICSPFELE
jgi:hypothetical protein